jgi:hypothetical protein
VRQTAENSANAREPGLRGLRVRLTLASAARDARRPAETGSCGQAAANSAPDDGRVELREGTNEIVLEVQRQYSVLLKPCRRDMQSRDLHWS